MAINTTATIRINLDFAGNANFNTLKSNLQALATALETMGGGKSGLDSSIASMQKMAEKVNKLEAELKGLKSVQDTVTNSTKASAAAASKYASSMDSLNAKKKGYFRDVQGQFSSEKRGLDSLASSLQNNTKMTKELASGSIGLINALFKTAEAENKVSVAAKKASDALAKEAFGGKTAMDSAANAFKMQAAKEKMLLGMQASGISRKQPELYRAVQNAVMGDVKALEMYRKAILNAESAQRQQNDSLKTLKGRLSEYEKQMDAIFRASYRFRMVGSQMIQFARNIQQQFSGLMTTFGDFEFALNRAAGAFNIFDTATSTVKVSDLEQSVLSLRKSMLLIPAKDVAMAMYYWGSTTGQVVDTQEKLNQQVESLTPVLQAAIINEVDYQTAIKGVYSILAQYYNGSIMEATHVTELLSYAAQKTAAEFPDLINSFKMVGPIAKANNVSFEDMVSLLGDIADLGIRGTMAGRALRQMFLQLVAPSEKARKALEALFVSPEVQNIPGFTGKSYFDIVFPKGQFVGVKGYIDALAKATAKLTPVGMNAFLKGIGTANEAAVLIALVTNRQRQLNKVTGEEGKGLADAAKAHEVFVATWNRLAGSWKGFTGALAATWENLKIQIGTTISEAMKPFIEQATVVVDKIREWAKANPEIVASLGKLLAVIAGMAAVGGVIITIAGSFMGLAAAITVAVRAFSPLFGIVSGMTALLGALVQAVVENMSYIQARVKEAMKTLQSSFGDGSNALQKLMDLFGAFTAPLHDLAGLMVRVFADLIVHFANLVKVIADLDKSTGFLKMFVSLLGTLAAVIALNSLKKLVIGILGVEKAMAFLERRTAQLAIDKKLAAIGQSAYSSTTRIQSGVNKVSGALSSMASAASEAFGILSIIAAVGFALYETNALGFRDALDKVMFSFKSLAEVTKQSNEAIDSFFSSLEGSGDLLRNSQKHLRDLALVSAEFNINQMQGPNVKGGSFGVKGRDIFGIPQTGEIDSYSYPYNGQIIQAGSKEELIAKVKKVIADSWPNLSSEVSAALDSTIQTNLDAGFAAFDLSHLSQATLDISKMVRGTPGLLDPDKFAADLVRWVFAGVDPGASKETISKQLTNIVGLTLDNVTITDTMVPAFTAFLQSAEAQMASKATALTTVYDQQYAKPLLAEMEASLKQGGSVSDMQSRVLEIWRKAALAGFDEKQVSDAMHTSLMQALGVGNLSIDPSGDITGAITSNVTSAFDEMLNGLTTNLTLQTASLQNESYDAMKPTFEDLASKLIMGGDQALTDAVKLISDKIVPNLDSFPAPLAETLKGWAELMAKKGVAGADALVQQMSATKGEISNKLDEAAKVLADAFGSGKDFAKKIKDALKVSDKDSIGKLLKQFLDKGMLKGFNAKDNIQANALAAQWSDSNIAGIEAALDNAKPKARAALSRKVLNWFKGVDLSKLPPDLATKLQGLLDKAKGVIDGKTVRPEIKIDPKIKIVRGGQGRHPSVADAVAHGKGGRRGGAGAMFTLPKPDISLVKQGVGEATGAVNSGVSTMKNTMDTLGPAANQAGANAMTSLGTGINSTAANAIGATGKVVGSIRNLLSSFSGSAWGAGYRIGTSWAQGLVAGIHTALAPVIAQMAELHKYTHGTSPPKKGPLKDIDKGARAIGDTWTKHFMKGVNTVHEKIRHEMKRVHDQLGRSFTRGPHESLTDFKNRVKDLKSHLKQLEAAHRRFIQGAHNIAKQLRNLHGDSSETNKRRAYLKAFESDYLKSAKNVQTSINRLRSHGIRTGHGHPAHGGHHAGDGGGGGGGRGGNVGGGNTVIHLAPVINQLKAIHATLRRMQRIENQMLMYERRSFNADQHRQVPKKIELDVNLVIDDKYGTINRAKESQIRRALLDALTISDLEHAIALR